MEPLLCTVAETAALLRVSVDTVKRSIRSGIIPAKRLRTTLRVSRAWLDSYARESAPVLLSRKQVAVKLGISVHCVHTLQVKGLLPTVKVGSRKMVLAASVNEYLKRNSFAFLRANGTRV